MRKNISDKLLENEVKRYKQILGYNDNLLKETVYKFYEADEEQPAEPATDPNAAGDTTAMAPDASADPNAGMTDPNATPMPDAGTADPNAAAPVAPDMTAQPEMGGEPDVEIDVTDIVNDTKELVKQTHRSLNRLQMVFDKINDIDGKLNKMDGIIQKMNDLEKQVELMRPPTEDERRKAMAAKSYPYNLTDDDYLEGNGYKNQTELEGKPDKMSMMDALMSNYDRNDVKKSFYIDNDDEDAREAKTF